MAIISRRRWVRLSTEPAVQVLPGIFGASLMKPWSIHLGMNVGLCYRAGSIQQHCRAINKALWRGTCTGPVPLESSTARPAKNSPRRKEKASGKDLPAGKMRGAVP